MPKSVRAAVRTRAAQRNADAAWRLLALSPGYRVVTAKLVRKAMPRFKAPSVGYCGSKKLNS